MNDKEIAHVASWVQNALQLVHKYRYKRCAPQLDLLAGKIRELERNVRRLKIALSRDWLAAAEQVCKGADSLISDIPFLTTNVQSLLGRRKVEVPRFSAIVEELHVLHNEFNDVEWDFEESALCATTEPITLEGIYLGPFKIALHLDKLIELYERTPYYVIAIEPNPPTMDETVTHPHVSNEVVCEGDGAAAITAALGGGRITDFFVLVRSLLTTYNPSSPYVSLAKWHGTPCYECGYVMDSESTYYCNFCDRTVCDDCSVVCSHCSEIVCRHCSEACEICESSLCPACAENRCSECELVCCESCLEEGLCPSCKEERDHYENEEEQEAETQEESQHQPETIPLGPGPIDRETFDPTVACVAIQPYSLGQVGVLPGQIAQ